ncbi:unnamed protein product [Gongylonema pulchrum]|uniref:Protein kinase domain-containing protein n=1 Tax=Gongylonema pulchrum TaxID=637853 RepID=A0A183E2V1_9BILA|nr:unnamed protein product [Gongylonema pulchrum]
MNSPSDDGQYTDTDKEEGVIEEERKSSGSSSARRQESSSGSPDMASSKERRSGRKNSSSSSDAEDEEARLRQKLLEKRSGVLHSSTSSVSKREVTEVIDRGTVSSISITVTSNDKKFRSSMRPLSPTMKKSSKSALANYGSSDEEMFSMQPKDMLFLEDEEARLRQKLLEKRSGVLHSSTSSVSKREVTEVIDRGTVSSISITVTSNDKKFRSSMRPLSPTVKKSSKSALANYGSSDEEMFSMQPKDMRRLESADELPLAIVLAQLSQLLNDDLSHIDELVPVASDEQGHQQQPQSQQQQSQRDHESRSTGRTATQPETKSLPKTSTSASKLYKERENTVELKRERESHVKDARISRSPRKREATPKRNSLSDHEVPSKRMHVEKTEEIKTGMIFVPSKAKVLGILGIEVLKNCIILEKSV